MSVKKETSIPPKHQITKRRIGEDDSVGTRVAIKTAMIPHSTARTGEYTRKYMRAAASASIEPTRKKITIPKKSPMSHRMVPSFKDDAAFAAPGDAKLKPT